MDNRALAMLAANTLNQKKAAEIVVIDIMEKATFADYLVIASGGSDRQVQALVDDVEEAFAKEGLTPRGIEGKRHAGWVLMDYGDVIVNLFTRETREKYHIEKVWGDCNFINLEE